MLFAASTNPFIERPLSACLASDAELEQYVLPITDGTPASLLALAADESAENTRRNLLEYIRDHRVQRSIVKFDARFGARAVGRTALSTILRTVRHYHNGLRGGLLHLSARITEDTRLHRSRRDRVGAAGPLFAAFDEFTDNPAYLLSAVTPMLQVVLAETMQSTSADAAMKLLTSKGMLRWDPPHLERFYGVVDELVQAGSLSSTSDEMDLENPLDALPDKALNAWRARRILATRPDLSCAGACAFMYGNEAVAGQLYGKLYKGFKRFQSEYGLSDIACNYFGDHASEDGEDGAPAFEAIHASLMLDAVIMYASLGRSSREAAYRGLHLFLETYANLVDGLCDVLDQDRDFRTHKDGSLAQEGQP
jgi:hypothetical protein